MASNGAIWPTPRNWRTPPKADGPDVARPDIFFYTAGRVGGGPVAISSVRSPIANINEALLLVTATGEAVEEVTNTTTSSVAETRKIPTVAAAREYARGSITGVEPVMVIDGEVSLVNSGGASVTSIEAALSGSPTTIPTSAAAKAYVDGVASYVTSVAPPLDVEDGDLSIRNDQGGEIDSVSTTLGNTDLSIPTSLAVRTYAETRMVPVNPLYETGQYLMVHEANTSRSGVVSVSDQEFSGSKTIVSGGEQLRLGNGTSHSSLSHAATALTINPGVGSDVIIPNTSNGLLAGAVTLKHANGTTAILRGDGYGRLVASSSGQGGMYLFADSEHLTLQNNGASTLAVMGVDGSGFLTIRTDGNEIRTDSSIVSTGSIIGNSVSGTSMSTQNLSVVHDISAERVITPTISGAASLTIGPPTSFTDSTNSTSFTTGSVVLAGGLGVSKNVYSPSVRTQNIKLMTGTLEGNGFTPNVQDIVLDQALWHRESLRGNIVETKNGESAVWERIGTSPFTNWTFATSKAQGIQCSFELPTTWAGGPSALYIKIRFMPTVAATPGNVYWTTSYIVESVGGIPTFSTPLTSAAVLATSGTLYEVTEGTLINTIIPDNWRGGSVIMYINRLGTNALDTYGQKVGLVDITAHCLVKYVCGKSDAYATPSPTLRSEVGRDDTLIPQARPGPPGRSAGIEIVGEKYKVWTFAYGRTSELLISHTSPTKYVEILLNSAPKDSAGLGFAQWELQADFGNGTSQVSSMRSYYSGARMQGVTGILGYFEFPDDCRGVLFTLRRLGELDTLIGTVAVLDIRVRGL